MTDKYFEFLCGFVGEKSKNYIMLLSRLYKWEFYGLIPNDDNRGEDGKRLRDTYLEKGGRIGSSFLSELGACTVLEMLIALAQRMEKELADNPKAMSAEECFWMFMDNLQWIEFDDARYIDSALDGTVYDKVQILLDRTYDALGNGGIFPLKCSNKDQRTVEIWYQMMEYLLDNFVF